MASRSRNELFSVLMVGIIILSGFLTTSMSSVRTDVNILRNSSSDVDHNSEINEELKTVQNNGKEDALAGNIKSSTFPKIAPSKYNSARPIYPSGSEGNYRGLYSSSPVSPNMQGIIDHHYVKDAWLQGCDGSGVNVAVVDTGVDFAHIDLQGTQAVVTDLASPYFDWPIAYDPSSMAKFIKNNDTKETWYANTSVVGEGPFEISHWIKIDGTNDFAEKIESWGTDPRDNVASGLGGDKEDYDLTDLYITRDSENWYVGFPTYCIEQNVTFGLLIDVDNETSGSVSTPEEKLVDTNTSHTNFVHDVAFSPDGSMIASLSKDKMVKVWMRDGSLFHNLAGHGENIPYSLAWSPNSSWLATVDQYEIIIWDVMSGDVAKRIQYDSGSLYDDPTFVLTSTVSFSPNGTWLAAASTAYIYIYDTASWEGRVLRPDRIHLYSIAFNPNGSWIGCVGNTDIGIYELNSTNIRNSTLDWNKGGIAEFSVPLYTLTGHTQPIFSISWSPNGQKMVSGGVDNYVKLWNVTNESTWKTLTNHSMAVYSVGWSANGTNFASSSGDTTIKIYDSEGNLQKDIDSTGQIYAINWSGANEIVSASSDLTVRIWNYSGVQTGIMVAHKPDYALYATGWSFRRGEDEWIHGMENATLYKWNSSCDAWEGIELKNETIEGRQASFQFGEMLFNEFAIPRIAIGDPDAIAVELFSVGTDTSHAQDTVQHDLNVLDMDHNGEEDKGLDWTQVYTSLSNFAFRKMELYTVEEGIISASNNFHFGYHPSPILIKRYGSIGLLVVDSISNGVYDKIYVDFNNDKIFEENDVIINRDSPIVALDNYNATADAAGDVANKTTPDGYPDISGGMLYFISDGHTPIPYSDIYCDRKNLENIIPGNGDLICFIGEFGTDPDTKERTDHGTKIASAIVAQGKLDTYVINGTAPGAKIITIGDAFSDLTEAWYFAVEGYDGKPGTGDEAKIVCNGFNYPEIYEDGFDRYSRLADYLSMSYAQEKTIFVASGGDDGYGYGTISSPSSCPGVITVGRATDYSRLASQYGGSEGTKPHYGDVASSSSRGPSALGVPKPDVVAIGTAIVDLPLGPVGFTSDGREAYTHPLLWEGSDASCAAAAGILALIYDAYNQTHGEYPNATTVRSLLMSGADDKNYDILCQGAGFVNASRSVKLAFDTDGLSITPSYWVPGDYNEAKYESFVKLMHVGESENTTFSINNHGTTGVNITVSDKIFNKTIGYDFSIPSQKNWYPKPMESKGDIIILMNETGIYQLPENLSIPPSPPQKIMDIDPDLWNGTDLLKVTMHANYSQQIIIKGDDKYELDYWYMLTLQDWEYNASLTNRDMFTYFPLPSIYSQEVNTMSKCGAVGDRVIVSNVLECRVSEPSKTKDGLVINLEAAGQDFMLEGLIWNVVIECYEKTDWSWIKLNGQDGAISLNVPTSGTEFNATVNIPSDVGIGSYEGAIYLNDTNKGNITTIPVLINVAANSTNFTFGGDSLVYGLYENNKLYGGNDKHLILDTITHPYRGDWRFFYFDIPNQGLFTNPDGMKVFVDVNWTLKPSDIDVFVFGKGAADIPSKKDSRRFGTAPLTNLGGSEEIDKPELKTATNDSEEVIAIDLTAGLNVIALHNVILNGSTHYEDISAKAGIVSVSPKAERIMPSLFGEVPLHFSSNMDWSEGVCASAAGPAISEKNESVEIPQDYQSWWRFPNWGEYLREGSYTRNLTLERVLMLDIHIWGDKDCPDLDLGVFRDINENWELDDDEVLDANCIKRGGTYWDYDADADADEHLIWVAPPDGQYIVKVLGFTIRGTIGHFDMEISITLDTGGKGYKILEAGEEDGVLDSTIGGLPSHTRITFNMSWDFPGNQKDGEYGGTVIVGPPQAPDIIIIPANIVLDRIEPDISNLQIMTEGNLQVNYLDNSTTNDNTPTFAATFSDMDRGELNHSTVKVLIDGVDVSSQAIVSIPFADPDGREGSLGFGYWIGMVTYTPSLPLSDIGHNIEVKVSDVAGNTASRNWTFTIDTQAPSLIIDTPSADLSTNVNVTTISGRTTLGSTLFIRGKEVEVKEDGSFSTQEELVEGKNEIEIKSVDWFDMSAAGESVEGNTVAITRIITLDTTKPQFSRITTSTTSLTNKDATTIIGKIEDERNEDVILVINNTLVTVNSDGTFIATLPLDKEGENEINIIATDPAGNTNVTSRTIVKDTIAPILTIEALTPNDQGRLNVKGTTEPGAILTINGKPVPVVNGAFSKEIELSYGANLIVIESKDAAGNVEEIREVVTYSSMPMIGFLPLLLISMIVLLLVGLFIGYVLLGRIRSGKRIEEEEVGEEEISEEKEEFGEEKVLEEVEEGEIGEEEEEAVEEEMETEEESAGVQKEEQEEPKEQEISKEKSPEEKLKELEKEFFGEE